MQKKYIFRILSVFSVLLLVAVALINAFTPASAAATKIMFLGDSITGNPGCWRALLWTRLQSAGITNIDFVGTQPPQGCAVPYDGDSEGHGGILATNMADQNQLPPWLTANTPDVVVMLLGTNNVWSGRAPSVILTAFSKLVDQMRASNPNVKIIVGQILPMNPSGCAFCAQGAINFDATIPGWASSKTTAQSPIIVVDQWTGFSTVTDTVDGVHPNDAGNQKISDKWYPALSGLLSPTGATATLTRTPTTGTNTPTITSTSLTGSFPDLVISSVVSSPPGWLGGCALTLTSGIRVAVRNNGTVNAGAFVVDANGSQQTVSGGLAAGASLNLWFTGSGNFTVTVDATGMVAESQEGNNTASYVAITGTPPVVCTRTPTPTGTVITNTPTRTITPTAITNTNTPTRTRTPAPADFSGTPLSGNAPLTVSFTHNLGAALPPGPVTCTWTFGDGQSQQFIDTCFNTNHAYTSPGVYTVSLQYSSPGGSGTVTKPNYISVSGGPTSTPTLTRTITPTVITPTPTKTPTIGIWTNTPTPTQPTGGACSPVTSVITAPFTFDGAGTFCWQIAAIPSYVNNWNNTTVSINGVNFSNVYVGAGGLPAKINNNYYIYFVGPYAWSHIEVR